MNRVGDRDRSLSYPCYYESVLLCPVIQVGYRTRFRTLNMLKHEVSPKIRTLSVFMNGRHTGPLIICQIFVRIKCAAYSTAGGTQLCPFKVNKPGIQVNRLLCPLNLLVSLEAFNRSLSV